MTIAQRLNNPFPYEAYRANYQGYASVSPQYTIDRLNEVLGCEGWKFQVIDKNVDMKLFAVAILGEIAIRDEQSEWIARNQFGDAAMVIEKGKTEPSTQAVLDANKKATSDALKKCASLLGVASDVYNNFIRVISVRNQNELYKKIIHKSNLDPNLHNHGVCILPDSYHNFYEERGWKGIFESDVLQLLDMNYLSRNNANLNDSQNSESKERQRVSNNSEAPIFVLEDVEALSGKHDQPYYRMIFSYNGVKTEVMAVGEMLDAIDQLNLKIGAKVSLSLESREAKGATLLRNIRLVG